jgi:hypothetical protein
MVQNVKTLPLTLRNINRMEMAIVMSPIRLLP